MIDSETQKSPKSAPLLAGVGPGNEYELALALADFFNLKKSEWSEKLSGEIPTKKPREPHPIASVIETFLHRARDIEEVGTRYVPDAEQRHRERIHESLTGFVAALVVLADQKNEDKVEGIKNFESGIRTLSRLVNSRHASTIQKSLFVGLFAEFDAFTGRLIARIYEGRPQLANAFGGTVNVSDVLSAQSLDGLRATIVNDEVEKLRRQSYVEQFEHLEGRFGLPLRKFNRWPDFIECAQRRNLVTHGDGVVSEQYVSVCKREGVEIGNVKVGDKLEIDSMYFLNACDLVMEVGLKLGQTLWRKVFPDDIERAGQSLNDHIYECLRDENWSRAEHYGAFALSQKSWGSEVQRRTCIVNVAIALKFGGKDEEALRFLKESDWTASLLEFRLADAVLSDKFDDAAELMKKIGKSGELIVEAMYHIWPLFRDFRSSPQFLQAYEEVYGRSFVKELALVGQVAEASAQETVALDGVVKS